MPPLAVTMGEPAGIGPELIARIWRDRAQLKIPPFVYVGSREAILAVDPKLPTVMVSESDIGSATSGSALPIFDVPLSEPIEFGQLNVKNGSSVIQAIDTAVRLTENGVASGVVTSPIHKEGLYKSGFDAPGHTEYLARLAGLPDDHSIMMLSTDGLRVIPVTVHVPLSEVATTLTADRILHAGLVAAEDLKHRFGIDKPRLAVAGLNPHAGEGGTIGMEEGTHITPAIWALRDHGIEVVGPVPADSLFHEEARASYDVALCMYHDQALIPLKTLDFWGGVNVTLGLPFVRTSPDHGTALSLAGTGKARVDSMVAALRTADEMVKNSAETA
ncbi:MAG: 4-hydroxythreonine-4-phosphate dehydrogenase PdxA [Kordiimonadaceae bacterium]|nr:4-hydroxythreonine-4-phosphate dehydrogenase PdxA [Kordiimonadaceae bacterium]MBO6570173.1 4-hydroxythreonine-4-phosphate dehydrogenase PdxA [Kordiimonadaceae bacterium]MBO6965729.1 4-hydroxythreonine-4-phosphate dehydrogenase PdxA [Kordiimonadaceae bacterium]